MAEIYQERPVESFGHNELKCMATYTFGPGDALYPMGSKPWDDPDLVGIPVAEVMYVAVDNSWRRIGHGRNSIGRKFVPGLQVEFFDEGPFLNRRRAVGWVCTSNPDLSRKQVLYREEGGRQLKEEELSEGEIDDTEVPPTQAEPILTQIGMDLGLTEAPPQGQNDPNAHLTPDGKKSYRRRK